MLLFLGAVNFLLTSTPTSTLGYYYRYQHYCYFEAYYYYYYSLRTISCQNRWIVYVGWKHEM